MHHSMMGSAAGEQGSHLASDHVYSHQAQQDPSGSQGREGHFASEHAYDHEEHHQSNCDDSWTDLNSSHQSTMTDFGAFGYGNQGSEGLTSLHRMPPPPAPLQPLHPQHQPQPQLPLLTIPSQQPTWPSMLTNPSSYASQSAPPLSVTPLVVPSPSPKTGRPAPAHQNPPRKTLTDLDRKNMCQYHLDNPNMKQTEIGAIFGVERSTVSKVLRHKEKYLNSEDRSQSPIKRTKNKLPDIDKAMASWVKRQQKFGLDISDDELLQQAHHFAINTGSNQGSVFKAITHRWVDKFKQKHGIGMPRLLRRASETNILHHSKMSASPALGRSGLFSGSPTGQSSPMSADKSDDDGLHGLGLVNFAPTGTGGAGGAYEPSSSQSATSINSALTDTGASSFSGSGLSSSAHFSFSPDPQVGGFLPADQATRQMQVGAGSGSGFQRPRSQTFPTLDLEYMTQQASTEPSTPRFQSSTTAPSSAMDSPAQEMNPHPFGIDNTMTSPPHLHRSSSNGSMTGAGHSNTTTSLQALGSNSGGSGGVSSTPVGSSPASPSQEDARRAADTLLNFIQNAASSGLVDHSEYSAVLSLTEKLRIHHQQQQQHHHHSHLVKSASVPTGMGGLSRIPEGDTETPPSANTAGSKVEISMAG